MSDNCTHGTVWGGLCVECGVDVSIKPNESAIESTVGGNDKARINPVAAVTGRDGQKRFAVMHDDENLVVTKEEAKLVEQRDSKRLLDQKKMILVLDLDLTLIHATTNTELKESATKLGKTIDYSNEPDLFEFKLNDNQFLTYHVKFRPHLKAFLQHMSKLFELHMYTMGTQAYARRIGEIIDPDHSLFHHRILARDACGAALSKDLKRLFPGGGKLAVVVDDRSDVWRAKTGLAENLLQIPGFHFFPVYRELNALPNDRHASHIADARVKADNDKQLLVIQDILMRLHKRFFDKFINTGKLSSAKKELRAMRRETFVGCKMLFSSVFPTNNIAKKREVLQEAFIHGATLCDDNELTTTTVEKDESKRIKSNDKSAINSNNLKSKSTDNDNTDPGDDSVDTGKKKRKLKDLSELTILPNDVTHVVARFKNTDKVYAALRTKGVYLVSHHWFFQSIKAMKRLPEKDFPVGSLPVIDGEPRPPYDNFEENDNDDDDDDEDDSSDNENESDSDSSLDQSKPKEPNDSLLGSVTGKVNSKTNQTGGMALETYETPFDDDDNDMNNDDADEFNDDDDDNDNFSFVATNTVSLGHHAQSINTNNNNTSFDDELNAALNNV